MTEPKMSRNDERAIKERRQAREAAAQRRDDEFLAEKGRAHAEAVAKIARLREQRLAAEVAPEKADAPRGGGRRSAKKGP
jgi:hypothetical protein